MISPTISNRKTLFLAALHLFCAFFLDVSATYQTEGKTFNPCKRRLSTDGFERVASCSKHFVQNPEKNDQMQYEQELNDEKSKKCDDYLIMQFQEKKVITNNDNDRVFEKSGLEPLNAVLSYYEPESNIIFKELLSGNFDYRKQQDLLSTSPIEEITGIEATERSRSDLLLDDNRNKSDQERNTFCETTAMFDSRYLRFWDYSDVTTMKETDRYYIEKTNLNEENVLRKKNTDTEDTLRFFSQAYSNIPLKPSDFENFEGESLQKKESDKGIELEKERNCAKQNIGETKEYSLLSGYYSPQKNFEKRSFFPDYTRHFLGSTLSQYIEPFSTTSLLTETNQMVFEKDSSKKEKNISEDSEHIMVNLMEMADSQLFCDFHSSEPPLPEFMPFSVIGAVDTDNPCIHLCDPQVSLSGINMENQQTFYPGHANYIEQPTEDLIKEAENSTKGHQSPNDCLLFEVLFSQDARIHHLTKLSRILANYDLSDDTEVNNTTITSSIVENQKESLREYIKRAEGFRKQKRHHFIKIRKRIGKDVTVFDGMIETISKALHGRLDLAINFGFLEAPALESKPRTQSIFWDCLLSDDNSDMELKNILAFCKKESFSIDDFKQKGEITFSPLLSKIIDPLQMIYSYKRLTVTFELFPVLKALLIEQLSLFFGTELELKYLFLPEIFTVKLNMLVGEGCFFSPTLNHYLLMLYSITELNHFFSDVLKPMLPSFFLGPEARASRRRLELYVLFLREFFVVGFLESLQIRTWFLFKYAYYCSSEFVFMMGDCGDKLYLEPKSFNPFTFIFLPLFEILSSPSTSTLSLLDLKSMLKGETLSNQADVFFKQFHRFKYLKELIDSIKCINFDFLINKNREKPESLYFRCQKFNEIKKSIIQNLMKN